MVRAIGVLTLGVGLGLFGAAGPAPGADLGNDCCLDLEARVSALEATTVTKGNRKVTLSISGQVDESLLWGTSNIKGGPPSQIYILANPNYDPEIDINADGKIGKDWHIGATLEIAIDQQRPGSSHDGRIDTHQTFVYVSNGMAKLSLGAVNEASKGLEEEGVVGLLAAPELDISGLVAWATAGTFTNGEIFGNNFVYGTNVEDGVKIDITPIAGLTISGSYSPEVTGGSNQAVKDVAVRYTTMIGKTVLITGGIGYRTDDKLADHTTKANAGIEDVTSGLFVQGSYGRSDAAFGGAISGWQVQGGIDKNLLGMLGKTDLYAEFGQLTGIPGLTPRLYGFGVQQAVDAAAASVYAGYRHYDSTDAAGDTADVVLSGIKIRF